MELRTEYGQICDRMARTFGGVSWIDGSKIMFGLFSKKKAYLIKWERNVHIPHEVHETVVCAKCEADATWKFLQRHNAKLEQIEILGIKEVEYYG